MREKKTKPVEQCLVDFISNKLRDKTFEAGIELLYGYVRNGTLTYPEFQEVMRTNFLRAEIKI